MYNDWPKYYSSIGNSRCNLQFCTDEEASWFLPLLTSTQHLCQTIFEGREQLRQKWWTAESAGVLCYRSNLCQNYKTLSFWEQHCGRNLFVQVSSVYKINIGHPVSSTFWTAVNLNLVVPWLFPLAPPAGQNFWKCVNTQGYVGSNLKLKKEGMLAVRYSSHHSEQSTSQYLPCIQDTSVETLAAAEAEGGAWLTRDRARSVCSQHYFPAKSQQRVFCEWRRGKVWEKARGWFQHLSLDGGETDGDVPL